MQRHQIFFDTLLVEYIVNGEWATAMFNRDKRVPWFLKILSNLKAFEGEMNESSKRRLYDATRAVRDQLRWEDTISPKNVGLILEKCARPWEVRQFYTQYVNTETTKKRTSQVE